MITANHWKHHNNRFKNDSLFQPDNYYPKEKKKKPENREKRKRESTLTAAVIQPKGNGINPWIDVDELLDGAGAGYIAEDMHKSFMP